MSTNVLEDLLEIEPFAAEVKRNPRTVRRWIDQPNGLPYTKLGNRILIHAPTAREWIFGRMQNVGIPHKTRVRQKRQALNRMSLPTVPGGTGSLFRRSQEARETMSRAPRTMESGVVRPQPCLPPTR